MVTPEERGKVKATEEIEYTLARYGKGPANKKITSVLIDKDLWKAFRVKCLSEGQSAGDTLSALINAYLKGGNK